MKKIIFSAISLALVFGLVGVVSAYDLNGISFNADYNPDQGYVAYIQLYDSTNLFHSPPGQSIEQYGNPGDAYLGPWSEGEWFNFEYDKAFGSGESQAWAAQNYIVTYWWDINVGEYIPMNGPGGDIYIYQPSDGVRPMGILYKGQWHMFAAGTNGLSNVRGEDFWWDLSDAGVSEGDTIEALAWWSNALGFPGLDSEKLTQKTPKIKVPIIGPTAIDMDGNGSIETLIFPGGGTPMSWHDPFYIGIRNAELILPDTTAPVITFVEPVTESTHSGTIHLKATCNEICNYINFWWRADGEVYGDFRYHYVHTDGTVFEWDLNTLSALKANSSTYTMADGVYYLYAAGKDLAGNWARTPGEIKVIVDNTPDNKNQCKNDGWKLFLNPVFKNQGDCVSYVQSNENAKGNKNK